MKLLVVYIGIVVLLASCNCKKIATYADGDDPIFGEGAKYFFDLTKNSEAMLIIPKDSQNYILSYKLPTDSTVAGYWAGINIDDYQKDTSYVFRIGVGSEFEIEQCKFRVLKVSHRYYDSDTYKLHSSYVLFQLLELPKYCPCENRKLRKFDAQKRKEEQENLDK